MEGDGTAGLRRTARTDSRPSPRISGSAQIGALPIGRGQSVFRSGFVDQSSSA